MHMEISSPLIGITRRVRIVIQSHEHLLQLSAPSHLANMRGVCEFRQAVHRSLFVRLHIRSNDFARHVPLGSVFLSFVPYLPLQLEGKHL